MSDSNGKERILKIGRKGFLRLEIEAESGDPLVVQVDVVAVHNAWSEVDASFRNEKDEVPRERMKEFNHALWNFVRGVLLSGAPPSTSEGNHAALVAKQLSLANAMEIMARLTEEAQALQVFFEVKSPAEPSSPQSTELRFST